MELKPAYKKDNVFPPVVLIVPYGIETFFSIVYILSPLVLIVPYGIETGESL